MFLFLCNEYTTNPNRLIKSRNKEKNTYIINIHSHRDAMHVDVNVHFEQIASFGEQFTQDVTSLLDRVHCH